MGIATGIDSARLHEASDFIEGSLGRKLPSRVRLAEAARHAAPGQEKARR